ncbi:MAG: DUF2911 domain-containing protein [Longimonas sp.]|uniref:DUF2911 domain-containing protein n=1 Tax=Longimonas sp. TaxID=2039626 RepID=UPI0033533008
MTTLLRSTRPLSAILVAGALLFTISLSAHAQERSTDEPRVSPNAEVHQTIGTTDVQVTYGRPSVRGRTIFGDLVPYGEVWRTGANEATTITFANDMHVEGERVEAGTYALFTIPADDDTWTLVLNAVANQWGAYNYDAEEDVLRTDVMPYEADTFREQMSFSFEAVSDTSATLLMHWADTALPVELSVADEE